LHQHPTNQRENDLSTICGVPWTKTKEEVSTATRPPHEPSLVPTALLANEDEEDLKDNLTNGKKMTHPNRLVVVLDLAVQNANEGRMKLR